MDKIIEEAFQMGVAAQKEVASLPVPEGTNPSALDKLVILASILAFIFVPFVVYDVSGEKMGWLIGAGILCCLLMSGLSVWLIKKAGVQNDAIDTRNSRYLEDACAKTKARLHSENVPA